MAASKCPNYQIMSQLHWIAVVYDLEAIQFLLDVMKMSLLSEMGTKYLVKFVPVEFPAV